MFPAKNFRKLDDSLQEEIIAWQPQLELLHKLQVFYFASLFQAIFVAITSIQGKNAK